MKVSEIDFLKFLPDLMQGDPDVKAIAAAQTKFYKKIASRMDVMSRWGKFKDMSERELDLFAEDFYIPWYKTSDTREIKVSNLEHFIEVWSRIGTPKAIETVLEDIYGSAELIEWFNQKDSYENGEFAVEVKDFASFTQENKRRFYNTLDIVKRKSQKLGSIFTVSKAGTGYTVGLCARGLKDGGSEQKADFYVPTAKVAVNNYIGMKVHVIKTDISLSVAE
jgi:P2-related tail formation protein|nr:MAG TPA: tail protein [Caudoviricetes sp.]